MPCFLAIRVSCSISAGVGGTSGGSPSDSAGRLSSRTNRSKPPLQVTQSQRACGDSTRYVWATPFGASAIPPGPRRRSSSPALREELSELERLLDEAAQAAKSIPHRRRNLELVHSLGRKLVAVHGEWADEVERDLGQAR